MAKFKVGDLITDKNFLYQVMGVIDGFYIIKSIDSSKSAVSIDRVDKVCIEYDLDKPLTTSEYEYLPRCNNCGAVLFYGDSCVRYAGDVYCDDRCLSDEIAEDSTINDNDVAGIPKIEKPLFELTKRQLEMIKKFKVENHTDE